MNKEKVEKYLQLISNVAESLIGGGLHTGNVAHDAPTKGYTLQNCVKRLREEILPEPNDPNVDVFMGAKFGDKFVDDSGVVYIYHCSDMHKSSDGAVWTYHKLIREPEEMSFNGQQMMYQPYDNYVSINGMGIPANLKYYEKTIQNGPNAKYIIRKRYETDTEL